MTKKAAVDQLNPVLDPIRELNALAVASTEKLVNFQFGAFKRYAELGIAQWKAAVELKDVAELQDYQSKNAELAKTTADAARADAEAMAELGRAYADKMQKLMQANYLRMTEKAA